MYTTAYREAVAQFGNINQLEPQLAELMDVFRSAEGLREDFDSTEKLIGEINSLAIWYSITTRSRSVEKGGLCTLGAKHLSICFALSTLTRYEEFHNSYGALTVEIVRRHQAHQAQERLVRDFMDRMESLQNGTRNHQQTCLVWKNKSLILIQYIPGSKQNIDEIHRRAVFSERHGKYLPVDLCPSIAVSLVVIVRFCLFSELCKALIEQYLPQIDVS